MHAEISYWTYSSSSDIEFVLVVLDTVLEEVELHLDEEVEMIEFVDEAEFVDDNVGCGGENVELEGGNFAWLCSFSSVGTKKEFIPSVSGWGLDVGDKVRASSGCKNLLVLKLLDDTGVICTWLDLLRAFPTETELEGLI